MERYRRRTLCGTLAIQGITCLTTMTWSRSWRIWTRSGKAASTTMTSVSGWEGRSIRVKAFSSGTTQQRTHPLKSHSPNRKKLNNWGRSRPPRCQLRRSNTSLLRKLNFSGKPCRVPSKTWISARAAKFSAGSWNTFAITGASQLVSNNLTRSSMLWIWIKMARFHIKTCRKLLALCWTHLRTFTFGRTWRRNLWPMCVQCRHAISSQSGTTPCVSCTINKCAWSRWAFWATSSKS